MKALTIWQPWASLIMIGAKAFEFRCWPAPKFVRGQRIVIHAGARKVKRGEIAELLNDPSRLRGSTGGDDRQMSLALDLLEKTMTSPGRLPLAMGLGTVLLGEPKRATELFAATMDPEEINPDMWGWPVSEVQSFEMPVPAKGMQGLWDWKD